MFLDAAIAVILVISNLMMKKIRESDMRKGLYINEDEYTVRNTLLHSVRRKEKRERLERRRTLREHRFRREAYILALLPVPVSFLFTFTQDGHKSGYIYAILYGMFALFSLYERSVSYLIVQNLMILSAILTVFDMGTAVLAIGNIVMTGYYIIELKRFRKPY